MNEPFLTPISRHVWDRKYRWRDPRSVREHSIFETWTRVSRAVASVEKHDRQAWAKRFFELLADFTFLPAGRILAGAGTGHRVTLFNCFVMNTLEDSLDGIFNGLKEGAVTMQQGGGVGYDFSTLRPEGTYAKRTGTFASGPVSFMKIWNCMCATLLSTGARRGAMMATLRCDHPDIETFIEAKQTGNDLEFFNLSVLVTDEFMAAVRQDALWPLLFPEPGAPPGPDIVVRPWPGHAQPVPCRVARRIPARALWSKIMRASYDYAEPGVLFIDRINRNNNLYYCETISCTNPCGEVPLPPYGACNLGSINLTRFVKSAFTAQACLDFTAMADTVTTAVRFLDNVIDLSHFPLARQRNAERNCRRIGLGITGLADALIMLGLHYDSEAARRCAADILRSIRDTAYEASVALGKERAPFPLYHREHYLAAPFIQSLPDTLRHNIARHGLRNSHLLSIAPAGTISLLANNVSSGIEPVFAADYQRRVVEWDGHTGHYDVTDYAVALWRREHNCHLPPHFAAATELPPGAHLAMQAALQPFVDNAISKTINIPSDYPFEQFADVYTQADAMRLKGCTTYRPNPVRGAVLQPPGDGPQGAHCCGLEREGD